MNMKQRAVPESLKNLARTFHISKKPQEWKTSKMPCSSRLILAIRRKLPSSVSMPPSLPRMKTERFPCLTCLPRLNFHRRDIVVLILTKRLSIISAMIIHTKRPKCLLPVTVAGIIHQYPRQNQTLMTSLRMPHCLRRQALLPTKMRFLA